MFTSYKKKNHTYILLFMFVFKFISFVFKFISSLFIKKKKLVKPVVHAAHGKESNWKQVKESNITYFSYYKSHNTKKAIQLQSISNYMDKCCTQQLVARGNLLLAAICCSQSWLLSLLLLLLLLFYFKKKIMLQVFF